MKKIRIGNEFTFSWSITNGLAPENLAGATDVKVLLKSCYGTDELSYSIVDTNKVVIPFTNNILTKVAEYNIVLTYKDVDGIRCAIDIDAFSIVPKTAMADEAEDFAVTSDMAIAYKGDSAFRVWQLQAGNEGKTYEDYIAFLQKPATDAAALVDVAIENANEAAVAANESALLVQDSVDNADAKAILANNAAILATEKASLADSKATLANDKAILAQSAADNANAKAAEVTAAVLSAGSLGSIKPTDAAPTPQRNGNYTFSIGGNKPAWLTAEAGVTTVKAGDGVAVVYDGVSAYTYTHVNVSSEFVTLIESLKGWIMSESFEVSNIVKDSNENLVSATIKYPDGDIGSISNVSTDGLGNITTMRFNRSNSNYATLTITRDSDGNATSSSIITTF